MSYVLILKYIRFVKLHRNIKYYFNYSRIILRYLPCKMLIINNRYWRSELMIFYRLMVRIHCKFGILRDTKGHLTAIYYSFPVNSKKSNTDLPSPAFTVEASVLDSFCQVFHFNFFGSCQVSDGYGQW